MSPQTFVQVVANAAPSIAKLQEIGFSEQSAITFRRSYICPERLITRVVPASNPLITLFDHWETGSLEIGMIRFLSRPVILSQGIQFALFECDPVLILNTTGEVIVEEFGTPGHFLWRAASSIDSFFDATASVSLYLTKRLLEPELYDDPQYNIVAALECSALAGGSDYLDFYRMTFGIDSTDAGRG